MVRLQEGKGFLEAFSTVQKEFQAQCRHHRKRGLRIHQPKYNQVIVLAGGACPMEECAPVVDVHAHFGRGIGSFRVQFPSESCDYGSISTASTLAHCARSAAATSLPVPAPIIKTLPQGGTITKGKS